MPPPPPPPGPPPPPAMAPPNPIAKSGASGGPPRDHLLSAIRQGTKLKKTVTVDKSAPLIAGRVAGSSGPDSSREVNSNTSSRMNGGPPGLGGLFAGGMPKLRPTGLGSSPARDGPMKAPPPSTIESRNINRGPPPQPPPASQKPNQTNAPDSTTSTPSRPAVPNKPPVGGYGKPNVAPRPPPPATPNMSALHADRPAAPAKGLIINGRAAVSRAQSMRTPRSPPVAPPAPANGPLVSHLSQEGLNFSKTGTLPHNFHHGHKLAPSPPGYRGAPTRPPGTRPPPPPSRPAPPTSAPPPPPPHRSAAAPPPPRMPPAAPNAAPPAPPTRNSSMRNGNTSSFMSELEARFAFHNVREFTDPQPYRNVVKQYNTRIAANAKQQAPAPPPSQTSTHLQLSQKMWSSHASQC